MHTYSMNCAHFVLYSFLNSITHSVCCFGRKEGLFCGCRFRTPFFVCLFLKLGSRGLMKLSTTRLDFFFLLFRCSKSTYRGRSLSSTVVFSYIQLFSFLLRFVFQTMITVMMTIMMVLLLLLSLLLTFAFLFFGSLVRTYVRSFLFRLVVFS
jgi:hypothetical protein